MAAALPLAFKVISLYYHTHGASTCTRENENEYASCWCHTGNRLQEHEWLRGTDVRVPLPGGGSGVYLHALATPHHHRRPHLHLPVEGHLHAAAEPVGAADAVRRIPRHGLFDRAALGEPVHEQDQGFAAPAQLQQREAQGERQ